MKAIDLAYFQQLVVRLQASVREIETEEQAHDPQHCQTYAPGRCPACFRIRQLEHEQIARVVDIFADELIRLFAGTQEPDARSILELTTLLAQADVWRCHARGQWPWSVVELQEVEMGVWPRLWQRLELDQLPSERQGQVLPLFQQVIATYQQSYHETCLHRWPLEHFEHYNSPLQPGEVPADFR